MIVYILQSDEGSIIGGRSSLKKAKDTFRNDFVLEEGEKIAFDNCGDYWSVEIVKDSNDDTYNCENDLGSINKVKIS